ncbi:MAG: hypothetical protein FJ265_19475 [Planctomycetes bacterium]|nr:hypothetical protein [Planctomycetota bacterium]
MRYQHARVVLTACLFAAAAAAQGTSGGPNPVGYEPTGFGVGRFTPSLAAAEPQEQDPYERRSIFQEVHGDFMNRMERYEPMISLGGTLLPNQRVNHEAGHYDQFGYFADVNLPWNVSTDGYLLFGAYYHGRRYNFVEMGPGGTLGDETLVAAGIKLGFGAFLDDNWLIQVETHPGAFTDADGGLHHEDFDFPSHALVTYRAVDNVFVKVGARYNQVYEDAPWLPLLGFSWDISGTAPSASVEADLGGWRLDVLLPEHVELSYWSSGVTGWLLGAEIQGAEYHVRTSAATGNQRDDVHIQEVIGYLGLVHRFNDYFSFTARAGAVLAGDYDLTTGAAGYNRVEGALDQGFFAEVSIGFDF